MDGHGGAFNLAPADSTTGTPPVHGIPELTGKDPLLDHDAEHARFHAHRGVTNVGRLLAEDRPQQPLLGCELGLTLGRDAADQDVAGTDLGTDPDHAELVQVAQLVLGRARDVASDLL